MEHTLALIRLVHEGDKKAREQLVEENMGLVYTIVRRFQGRGYEKEDLISLGCIGLIKAIDHFDPSFEVKFSTYAVPMITGEIRRFLRDDGMIRVSRSLKETAVKAYHLKEEIEKKTGQEPTMEEISVKLGIEKEELVLAMESAAEISSFSQTVYNGDGTPVLLQDRIADKEDANERLLNRMLLRQLILLLDKKEQKLILLRYFEEKTQREAAKCLGMTQVQVSRAEKKILQKMREAGNPAFPDAL